MYRIMLVAAVCFTGPVAGASLQPDFIENAGQWDQSILFHTRAADQDLLVQRRGVTLLKASEDRTSRRLQLTFLGANPDPAVSGEAARDATVNFYLGADRSRWREGVHTFGEVRWRDLYPGIDLVLRRDDGTVQRIYRVAPGADYTEIGFRVDGADAIAVSDTGDLELQTADGLVTEPRPIAWQETPDGDRPVQVEYVVDGREVRYKARGVDPRFTLVIDPPINYGAWLAGSSNDEARDISSSVVVGKTTSKDFPLAGAAPSVSHGSDGFILRHSAGKLTQVAYFGGTRDNMKFITCDNAGTCTGSAVGAGGSDAFNSVYVNQLGTIAAAGWT